MDEEDQECRAGEESRNVQEEESEKTCQMVKKEKMRDPEPSRGRLEQTLKKDEPEPEKKSLSCVEGRGFVPEERGCKEKEED